MKFLTLLIVLLFYTALIQAQLCNNNLGDPIVKMDFGDDVNPQYPNTSYTLVGGCPKKGEYTISGFLFGCGGYWVQMTGDNTPNDLNGNYMLVDAESTPGVVFQATASNLCENMTYQYSAYITNVLQTNLSCGSDVVLPNLTFTISTPSGKVLASYNTGDIPITDVKQWKQFGLTYKTTAGINAVVLKITTNPKYGCGSAFAIDDIIFQNCGPSVKVTIDGDTTNQNVCSNYANPFIMKGTYSAGFNDPVVQWQNSFDTGKFWKDIPGETTTTYTVPHRLSGVILYRMVVAEKENINSVNCRARSNSIYTEIHPLPAHQPIQYISGCTGKDYLLPSANTNAFEISWNGPKGFSSNDRVGAFIPDFQFADTGLYKLKQTYDYGCVDLDSFYLSASPGITISAQPSVPICEGESEALNVTSSRAGNYKWTPSAGLSSDVILNPVASPIDSTIYKIVATNSYGCEDSAFLPINVYKKPVVNAGSDKLILSGDTAVLNGLVKGTAINYSWSPGIYINDVNLMQPKVYPVQDITYTLNAASTVGCGTAYDNVNVQLYKGFFIPNSFTPNGDGKNDKFKLIPFDNYKLVRFVIYNRWGAVVFTSTNINDGWNGTYKGFPQPTGSYIYYIELLNSNSEKIIKQGTITLLR
jgi:gliding motility-associated-like protein